MKLADLKQGMVCELRNGNPFIVSNTNTGRKFYNDRLNAFFKLSDDYNDDLTNQSQKDYDIVKVTFGDETIYERPKSNLFFEPKKNEDYWFIGSDGKLNCFVNGFNSFDYNIMNYQQVFKTKEEAQAHLEYKQAELKIIKWIAQNDNVVLDWGNGKPNKWIVFYSHENKKLIKNNNIFSQYLPKQFYLSSRELAQRLIDELGTELKIWLGVRE